MNFQPKRFSNEKLLEILSLSQNATAIYTGEEITIQSANDAMISFWGKDKTVIGKPMEDAIPELTGQPFIEILQKVWQTGITYEANDTFAELAVDGRLQGFYFDFIYRAIKNEDGEVECILHTANDVTELNMGRKLIAEAKGQQDAFDKEKILNEKLAAVNEKLSASNEELAAALEALSATNEELQKTKDSLQLLNEELEFRIKERTKTIADLYKNLEISNKELAAVNEELTASGEEQLLINGELILLNEKLKISQDELKLAIDAAGMATFDLNPLTGRFAGNDLIKSWFGLQPEDEIELHKATDVIAEMDRERVVTAIQKSMDYSSGGDYDTYYTIINPESSESRIVRAKGKAQFNEQKQAIRLSGVLQDVTEIKQDEQRKNDFIAMVSHELKTPLTSLTAYVQMLQRKANNNGDTFSANALDLANKQAKKMTTMINGFLNVSRLESGKIHIENQHFDMAKLMAEIQEESILTVRSHNIIFEPIAEIFINADRDKIGQVINNLVSNGIKYSPSDSTITVVCKTVNNSVLVSVKDEGSGIKTEDQQKLFERYYRVKDQPINIVGFGIGLYLCAEIIYRHNGEIWVESEPGQGSTFFFSLPM